MLKRIIEYLLKKFKKPQPKPEPEPQPQPQRIFINPSVPNNGQPGEHITWKNYGGIGHANRVFAIKWPSYFCRELHANSLNSHTKLVLKDKNIMMRLYQIDSESGNSRPCYAIFEGQASIEEIQSDSLFVLSINSEACAAIRRSEPVLPEKIMLKEWENI